MRISDWSSDVCSSDLVRPTLADSGSLIVKHLGLSQTLLVASPAQLVRQGRVAAPTDLARFDTVAMSSNDGRASWSLYGPEGAEYMAVHRPRYVADDLRSEEHTSELQSLMRISYAVFCLKK